MYLIEGGIEVFAGKVPKNGTFLGQIVKYKKKALEQESLSNSESTHQEEHFKPY